MAAAVLIVNYHAYDDLRRCLESLLPHLAADDAVVVVDYECDETALARAVDVPVRIITVPRPDNLGFAAGVNLAARQTAAPFLLLLNPDTIVEGPIIRTLETWLGSHPDAGVAGPRVLNADGTVQASARRFPGVSTLLGGRTTWLTRRFPGNWLSARNLLAQDAAGPVDVDWVSGSCLMTRRDVFDAVGGFDEAFFLYWEDADYGRRVAAAGFRSVYVPAASVRHVGGRSADHHPANAIRAFHTSAFRLYWKHASAPGRLAAPIARIGLWLRGEWLARRAAPRKGVGSRFRN
ncbi:MAG: glycosyltransferase family 2 protein [Acidobacteriota bacterium]